MATDKVVHQLAIRAGNKLRDERLMLATAEPAPAVWSPPP